MNVEDLQAPVTAGAQLLDEKRPGWAGDIRVGQLDMSDPIDCILGQLYGSYCEGLEVLVDKGWVTFGERHGFTVGDPEEPASTWIALQQFWLVEIRTRKIPKVADCGGDASTVT